MTTWTNIQTGSPVQPAAVSFEPYVITNLNNPLILTWPFAFITSPDNTAARIMNISTAIVDAVINMPDATQVSVGMDALFVNVGAEDININDNADGFLATIPPGIAIYFYLTDNTTAAGEWGQFTFGAGTSEASAALLQGYGLLAFGTPGKLNVNTPISVKNNGFLPIASDRGSLFIYVGGTDTCTLPLPSGTNIGNGYAIAINNESRVGGILTIDNPYGFIDYAGQTSLSLPSGSSTLLICDGTSNYYTLGLGTSTFFTYGVLPLNVTGIFTLGEYELTDQEARNQIINVTGTLTQNSTLIFPANPFQFYITNDTTGSYSLSLTITGGTPIEILAGERLIIVCDGTDLFLYPSFVTAIQDVKFIIQQPSDLLPEAQALSDLSSGLLKVATTTGVLSTAINGTDYYAPGTTNIFMSHFAQPAAKAGGTYISATATTFSITDSAYEVNIYAVDDNLVINNDGLPSATTPIRNTILGANTALNLTSADNSVIIGYNAAGDLETGLENVVIGSQAGATLTTQSAIVIVGTAAGGSFTTGGSETTLVGWESGVSITTANYSTFCGYLAGGLTTIGWSNTFIGRVAGYSNNEGYYNTCVGDSAGYGLSLSSTGNVFAGFQAGEGVSTYVGDSNVGIGYQAMANCQGTLTDNNIAIGTQAGYSVNQATNLVLLGNQAGYNITSASNCILLGQKAGYNLINTNDNVMVGNQAGYNNLGNYNVFLGSSAGYTAGNISGLTLIGCNAGSSITIGAHSAILGFNAGKALTTGNNATLVGSSAGLSLTTANDATLIGNSAGQNLTIANGVTIVGSNAGIAMTDGTAVTLIGSNAGASLTSGIYNTVCGFSAFTSATKAYQNAIFGDSAGSKMTTDYLSTIVGSQAGALLNGGGENTYVGALTGVYSTTCTLNTFLGSSAGKNTSTGGKNLILGAQSGLTLVSGAGNLIMGYNADVKSANTSNSIALGVGATVLADNVIALGNGQNVVIGYNATNGASTVVGEAIELQSTTSTTPAGIYFAPTAAGVHAAPTVGGSISVNVSNDQLAYRSPTAYQYVDTTPQPYFDVQMDWDALASGANVLSNAPAAPAVYFPFSFVSSNLETLLQSGYPGGFYPDAVVTVEATIFLEFSITPLEYYINASLYKFIAPSTYTPIAGVTVNQQYKFRNTSSFQQMAVNVKVNCLLTDIVDATATEWGIALDNVTPYTVSPDLAYVVGSANVQNAYLITGGIT